MIYREAPKRKFLPTLDRFEPVSMDHSATKAFKECPRKYFYRYVLGRVAKREKSVLVFGWGNAVHAYMEEVYQNGNHEQACAMAFKAYKSPSPTDSKKEQTLYSVKRLITLLDKLWEFYSNEKKLGRTEVLSIEQTFNIDLPDGTQTGGRFDQIIRVAGKNWIRDWKSTSKQISYFAMGFNPNDQATRYAYALSRLNGWSSSNPSQSMLAGGIYFTVIQNMETESSLKIETVALTKHSQELILWESEQIFWYKQMAHCREADIWPMSENNCSWCDYREVCTTSADSSKEFVLKDKFELKPWDHNNVVQEAIKG